MRPEPTYQVASSGPGSAGPIAHYGWAARARRHHDDPSRPSTRDSDDQPGCGPAADAGLDSECGRGLPGASVRGLTRRSRATPRADAMAADSDAGYCPRRQPRRRARSARPGDIQAVTQATHRPIIVTESHVKLKRKVETQTCGSLTGGEDERESHRCEGQMQLVGDGAAVAAGFLPDAARLWFLARCGAAVAACPMQRCLPDAARRWLRASLRCGVAVAWL